MRIQLFSALATLLAALLSQSQDPTGALLGQPEGVRNPYPAFQAWSSLHGGGWQLTRSKASGYGEFLWGGAAAPVYTPDSDEDFADLARIFVEDTVGLHGIAPSSLELDRVTLLPLGQIGSTDKWAVSFDQIVGGVPVWGGRLNVLLDASGSLLALQSRALPDLEALNIVPAMVDEGTAASLGREHFTARSAMSSGRVEAVQRVILPVEDQKGRHRPTLAWRVDVYPAQSGSLPEAWRFWIDERSGKLIESESLIHSLDVGGQVQTRATPGTGPDVEGGAITTTGVPHLRVTSSAGTVLTDAGGAFSFPGVEGPLDVSVDFVGTWVDVRNTAGADHTQVLIAETGAWNTVVMNPGAEALVTAQANAYLAVNRAHDWIKSVVPTDTTPDFQAISNVNLAQSFNAFYDGISINFHQAGGGCVNTAYSTVVVHELGHWLNDRYGTGNGPDGMGEGNADVFAMYLHDTPVVGEDFCGTGCDVRTGLNMRQFCGEGNGSCHGEVHLDGEVWMGAAWKIRSRLEATLGEAAGELAADTLFLSWLIAFDQTQIDPIIEQQWLVLDDNNGNITDGTPNYGAIDGGFRDQGFPGYDLPAVAITGVTQVAATDVALGHYLVEVETNLTQPEREVSAELLHRVNGGVWTSSPMAAGPGGSLSGTIPGPPAPATVDYFVRVKGAGLAPVTFPTIAPGDTLQFSVGSETVIFFDDFEGPGDNGWEGDVEDGGPDSDSDWERGAPQGLAGDPASAYSGQYVWGTDLGLAGGDGAYENEVHTALSSPDIDCSTAVGTRLRFRRWLTIEDAQHDRASVVVNDHVVWTNPVGEDLLDTGWVHMDLDISEYADGESEVEIEFFLETDETVVYGGWNIDDVELVSLTEPDLADCNGNELHDTYDIWSGVSSDCNEDGVPDECQLEGNDCDYNGVPDDCDVDCNANGTPDACENGPDCNQDGVPDECQLEGNDCDYNGVPDECDVDCNANGTPDACETGPDCNQDGVPDECQLEGNDCDYNGVPDECDVDCNANGTPDACENGPDCNQDGVPDECQLEGNDCDYNGVPDECDVDCNSNGTPDACESGPDCNQDGVPDRCQLADNDCDHNGVPDECDPDCNQNGTPDGCESGPDCDEDGVPDECQILSNDCNENGILDACEPGPDCNQDGIPDECQLIGNDCDSNGIPDDCDPDCDANGVPEACEWFADCNENGLPDYSCDIASGFSLDANNDGIPDECSFATAFCFGDGSGADCPCNNNGAPGKGCANSTGSGGVLSAEGGPSIAADDATFHGRGLLFGQAALLFSGGIRVQGGAGVVFGDGLRCAGGHGTIVRLGVRIPNAYGKASWDTGGLATANGWAVGETRTFQAWYRDSNNGPCGNGFNLTNGLEIVFQP